MQVRVMQVRVMQVRVGQTMGLPYADHQVVKR